MSDTNLQDFVTNTVARSHITFGDVRRLQRNCLPGGIQTREEAEALICLNGKVGRADKAWAQWLVAAIASFAANRERHGVAADEGTVEWLKRLLGTTTMSTSVGRRIARELRREVARLPADTSPAEDCGVAAATVPPDGAAAAADAASEPHETPRKKKKRIAAAPRSGATRKTIKRTRPARQPRHVSHPLTMAPMVPPMVWSAGLAEKHLQFRLAAPCP